MIHLDTSFLIRALVNGSDEDRKLRSWLGAGKTVGASAIVWAEFLCGPVHGNDVDLATTVVEERVPFTAEDATLAASLFDRTGRRRGSLADCMVAGTAIRCSDGQRTKRGAGLEGTGQGRECQMGKGGLRSRWRRVRVPIVSSEPSVHDPLQV